MSDILTSLTVSKRKLMTYMSSAVTVVAGALSLPRTALAEDMNTEIDSKGIDMSTCLDLVKGYGDLLGVMILVPFEGPIRAYPVTGTGKTIQINELDYVPPEPRTTLARTDIHIEVFEASPGHIFVKTAGGNICVQT